MRTRILFSLFLGAIFCTAAGQARGEDLAELHREFLPLFEAGRYAEAEEVASRMLKLAEEQDNDRGVSGALQLLGAAYFGQEKLTEAERTFRRAVELRERTIGPSATFTAVGHTALADVHYRQRKLAEAEAGYRRAHRIYAERFGPKSEQAAAILAPLANIHFELKDYAEAETLEKSLLEIRKHLHGPEHPEAAESLNRLGILCYVQSRFLEAETALQRALSIREEALGPNHSKTLGSASSLALVHASQGKYAEAEPLYRRCVEGRARALGREHSETLRSMHDLARLYRDWGKFKEARPLYEEIHEAYRRTLGADHPKTLAANEETVVYYLYQGDWATAEPLLESILETKQRKLGEDNPALAPYLHKLGWLAKAQFRWSDAAPLLDRAIGLLEREGSDPPLLFQCLMLRAEIDWQAKRSEEAVAGLGRALDLAEQLRKETSAEEQERAAMFASFARAFERMGAWQQELDAPAEAFTAVERFRARSLIDQLNAQGIDLLEGLPESQAAQLAERQAEAQAKVAALLEQLAGTAEREEATREIEDRLVAARKEAMAAYAAARNASPQYRLMVQEDFTPVALEAWHEWVRGFGGLAVSYVIGKEEAYAVIAGRPEGPSVEKLHIPASLAEKLGIELSVIEVNESPEEAPLIQEYLAQVLTVNEQTVQQRLARPRVEREVLERLHLLWQLLIPAKDRAALVEGKYERLFIVPDGSLLGLPYEALVVSGDADPQYLLDAGPPVAYAPSATVAYNLARRESAATPRGVKPVLSIANPEYSPAEPSEAAGGPTAQARYTAGGGRLSPLPHSGIESHWAAEVFEKRNIPTGFLRRSDATERWVRRFAPQRKILHFACHGLADREYGNFFGALALTPGPDAATNPADDGFLTLPEIYDLDLSGNELAILSACQTNYGPTQRGEGVWALSRGFLVAGSRRVVASNWLVDDEAAASLVSVYCSGIAQAEEKGETADYAASLHAAKRWVRKQEAWSSPYYWATFVHLGPP